MNKTELTKLNVGYNLDWLMNLDPRGYGVCRILYDGAIKYTGKPLSLNGAEGLVKNIKKGEKVFLLGPNGCGKTTLLSILAGVNRPDRKVL